MRKDFILKNKAEDADLLVGDNYGENFGEYTKSKLKENPNLDVIFIGVNDIHRDGECIGITINQAKQLIEELNEIIKILE